MQIRRFPDFFVVWWSGRCCRHSASHSGKCETKAGSEQQQQEFIMRTKPAHNQHESNRHTQQNKNSVRGPQRKQANSAIESFLSTFKSTKFVFPRSSSTTDFSIIPQPVKSNNISNESLDNYLLNHINRIYKSRIKRVESLTRHGPERDSR